MKLPSLVVAAFGLVASITFAQQPPSAPPAPPPESAQFDFWVGEWDVTAKNGKVVGHSVIQKIASGWGILENWTALNGANPGKSINAWNPAKKCWQQFWVGSGGSVLELSGGLDASGSMVIQGESPNPKGGTMLNRITYTPNADGTVRQHWEISLDHGATWQNSFDGLYHRK